MEKSICILRAIRSFRSCALLGSLTALLILSSTAVLAHDDDPHAANQSAPSADDSVDMDMPMDHDMSSMTESHGRSHDDQMDASHDANAMAGHDHHDHGSMVPGRRLVSVLILLTFAIAAGLIASIRRRARHGSAEVRASGKNLFDIPVLGTFLRSRQFLYWLIVPTLIVFTFIVAAGLFDIQTTQNPAVLLTWILWWPAVVFTFFLVGRIWCAICPFGYLGDVAQKIFSFRWKVPAFLRNMWWRIGLFVALTWATTVWALDRWPRGTAWLALAETLGAVLLAFIFEKRSFCRYLCPVGGVFGLYSMTAPMRLAVKDRSICQTQCPGKNCYDSCGWFQFPSAIDRNAECSLCLNCVRACPHDNIALNTQPFGTDLAEYQPKRKSLDEVLGVFVVLGVALLQTVVMLNVWNRWQAQMSGWLHLPSDKLLYTVLFLMFGVALPLGVFLAYSYLTAPRAHSYAEFIRVVRNYAYSFLPLALALHAAHNFHHLFGEGAAMWSGLRNALARYTGWTTLASGASMAAPPGPNVLFVMQWVTLMAGLFLAFRVGLALARRSANQPARIFRDVVPILLFATAFTVLNLIVLAAPMAHRH